MRNATHGNTYNRSKPSGELRGYKACSKRHGQVKKGVAIRSLPQLVTNDALKKKREKGFSKFCKEASLGRDLLKLDELPYLTSTKLSGGLHVKPVGGQSRLRHLLKANAKARLRLFLILNSSGIAGGYADGQTIVVLAFNEASAASAPTSHAAHIRPDVGNGDEHH